MKYPTGACRCCGERLFGHVDGGYACHNCNVRYPFESGSKAAGGTELRYSADGASEGVEFRYGGEDSSERTSSETELRRSSGE